MTKLTDEEVEQAFREGSMTGYRLEQWICWGAFLDFLDSLWGRDAG